ncbi:MAG TPA: helix-turn-helix domain-containing protein [Terriglobales bacterium]|nr:helix-turn-helix domain-containing protein [Terriglobales bacterium]
MGSDMSDLLTGTEARTESKIDDTMNRAAGAARNLSQTPELSLRVFRAEAEMHAISSALHKTGWNRKRAAQLLSISYRGLLYKIRRHNIAPPAQQS